MTSVLLPVVFDPPLVNPTSPGLFSVTQWTDSDGPLRWLPSGVEVTRWNFGLENGFGVWAAAWDARASDLGPEDVKKGERPVGLPAFAAITTWSADECDLTAIAMAESRTRAAQAHRLQEPLAVEREFAARMLADAGTPDTASDVVGAVGHLEDLFARTNGYGFIHASPAWAASAAQANLIVRSGGALKTPLGHTWVFGGGYGEGLGNVLVASSQPFGWRGQVEIRTAEKLEHNRFRAIAERSLVVGYEALIGAVDITG